MKTGIEIYEFIKPNLGNIAFHGETNADNESIKNIGKYEDLLYYLIDDLHRTYMQVDGRSESSAKEINKEIERIVLLIQGKIIDMEIKE